MIIVLLMESEILKMKLMKSLNLKDKFLKLPIIQGGMGIGVSRCRLAGAVAKEGGMGVLSTSGRNKSACTAGADQKSERNRRR